MTTTTSYPGVYIAEDASPSISVQVTDTTVPIIALYSLPNGPAQKFNNFLEFNRSSVARGADLDYMRAYFECGGGPCYVASYKSFLTEAPLYDDITLLVTGGEPSIYNGAVDLCQPGIGLFTILDGPTLEITDGNAAASYPESPFGAVYYPYLKPAWTTQAIPASFVMAALYCASDRTRGVWKSPANMALPADYQACYTVTDDLQGQYNSGKAINMIRKIDDRSLVVCGARTLEDSDNWRYISVRRLFNSAERDIKAAMQTMVFEPNNQPTWEKVRSAIINYLYNLWQQGALAGATEQEAYFVKIGKNITMSDDDIAQGKMTVQVGMAAVRPAEFIILQFTQNVDQG
ncbi:phage tail sheath family protein [Paraburkholderia sp. IW21]|uniref:phage tail sheath family protein n=1 Tax=Paraburkholderia sp. IW21 TaxID=3242488 RepID=UPI0035202C8F